MLKEFKEFAVKGNAIDLAVGVIIGRTSEFFDFFVYAIASVLVFPAVIFPYMEPIAATLWSFALFPLAFIARPIGTQIFMKLDRRYGRGTKLTIALFLVSRTKSVGDEGDLAALRDVEERIQAELKRVEKMEDSTDGIRRHCDTLEAELGKARKGLDLLLRKAKATLTALDVELVEEAVERACPLELPQVVAQ